MEDVEIATLYLGSSVVLVGICLGMATRALGKTAARAVKIFIDSVMFFLGAGLVATGMLVKATLGIYSDVLTVVSAVQQPEPPLCDVLL